MRWREQDAQEANAGALKGDRKLEAATPLLQRWPLDNWPDTGPMAGLERALT
jgi:hypothetical protein